MNDSPYSIEILQVYGWWQLATCLFAFLALLSIWYHIGRKQQDTGQVWLALSVLCWSLSGAVDLYFAREQASTDTPLLVAEGWRSIFSLFNSFFILLSLPWFRYLPSPLSPVIKSKYWLVIIGLPFLFSLVPTMSKFIFNTSLEMISEFDVYYAVLTLFLLGWVLWESFVQRRLPLLAILSVICILITLLAQILKITAPATNQLLFSAIFKTSLIMIFFALALSWVKDLSEKLQINTQNVFLELKKQRTANGKYQHLVTLSGILEHHKQFQLTATHFNLLHKFAKAKINDKEGWLEIMPKGEERSGKQYDIRDYNEVKRLLHKILDQLYGKENWTKVQHEEPLKSLLFERSQKRDRKIRLALPPDQIGI